MWIISCSRKPRRFDNISAWEIVELGSVGYKPAIEHLTPMKVVRQAYGAIVDTEF